MRTQLFLSSAFLFLTAKINKKIARLYKNVVSCIRLDVTVICIYCSADNVIRNGKNQKEEQRYLCKKCKIRFINNLERRTKAIVSFNVGARTNRTLKVVLKTLQYSEAIRIYTDRLASYKYLISKPIHRTAIRGTNHIERKNLSLRTHLKRLNRRTICFSRSITILTACLRIYFWG